MNDLVRPTYDIAALRAEQFPVTRQFAYFNHAGISPLPRVTADAMREAIARASEDPAGMFPWFLAREQAFINSLRTLINAAHTSEIVGVQSTSLGNNLVAHAIPWQRGKNLVLADVEFPSNAYPWIEAAERNGVEVRQVPAHLVGLTLDSLTQVADDQTMLIAVSAVQFLSGHRTDLVALGAFCKAHNIILAVDGIQSVGLLPMDVQALNISILCAGGQKALMGPPGQGFLYIRGDLAEQMRPHLVSGNSTVDYLHWLKYDRTPLPGAARFAMGTPNIVGMIGLSESVKLLLELGISNIDAHVTALTTYTIEQLEKLGYSVLTPKAPHEHASIVTFRAAESDEATTAIVSKLAAQHIIVIKHWDAPKNPYIRVSFHCYNTLEDVERLLNALKTL